MAQITWRNVDPANTATNAAAIQRDSTALADSLKSLGAFTTGIGEKRKDVNTEALLRQIQGLDTAGLEAARTSGQFGAEALEGQNVDTGALFSALKGQDAAIAKQATDVFNQEATARTQADAPILAASQAQLAGITDPKQIAGFTAGLGESGLSSQAQTQMLNAAKAAETSMVSKARGEAAHTRSQAALAREDRALAIQDKTDTEINNIFSRESEINQANRSIGAKVAEEFGLQVDASGIPIVGEVVLPELPENPSPQQQAEYDFAVATAENTGKDAIARRMVELGLQDRPTVAQNEATLLKSLKGAKPTQKAMAVKLLKDSKDIYDALPETAQTALTGEINRAVSTIDLNLNQKRAEHQVLVGMHPTTPAETQRRKTLELNDVLRLAEEKASEESYFFGMFGPSKGVGGNTLRELITDTMATKFAGKTPEPWMLESALLASVQTKDEAMTPEVAEKRFLSLVERMVLDTSEEASADKIAKSKKALDNAVLAAPLAKTRQANNLSKTYRRSAGKASFSDMFTRGTQSSLYSGK